VLQEAMGSKAAPAASSKPSEAPASGGDQLVEALDRLATSAAIVFDASASVIENLLTK
jgi:hypothetical protein